MKKKGRHVWLLTTWNKSTQQNIKIVDNIKVITPNLYKVRVNHILYIQSCVEKNYTCVVLKDKRQFYYSGSMNKFHKETRLELLTVNKKTKVCVKYFKQSLGVQYLFSKYLDVPIYVSKPFRENVKKN
ncbi:hypothetical protein C1H87_10375 [Flavivirga eckloniae]|uniref:Uncharacterized protein n=1 Tax=Flavivirga eckloniae TaxID=1803846 RepID=A0A2K9PPT1_9FLAO|nr:hypothetical protein C1H87_10375 [Flavivirga eckloniae]